MFGTFSKGVPSNWQLYVSRKRTALLHDLGGKTCCATYFTHKSCQFTGQCQVIITWTHRVMRRLVGTYRWWTKFPECCIIATHILFRWARQDKVGEAGPSRAVTWIFINEPSAHGSGLWVSQSDSSEGGISQTLTNDESLPEATLGRVFQWLKSFFPLVKNLLNI